MINGLYADSQPQNIMPLGAQDGSVSALFAGGMESEKPLDAAFKLSKKLVNAKSTPGKRFDSVIANF